jgi:amino acid adenylation domain-containing protein
MRLGDHVPVVEAAPRWTGGSHGVDRLVAEQASRRPDACAVRDPLSGRDLTYRDIWELSGMLAHELARVGALPGDVVALALDRSPELVVAMLGVARAGAMYLALDPRAPVEYSAAILEEAGVTCVVVMPGGEVADLLASGVERVTVPVPAAGRNRPSAGQSVAVGIAHPLYVAFTSGTSGRPKGVVIPHGAVRNLVTDPLYCTIAAGERVANAANPAFDATTFEIWATLAAGGSVVVLPSAEQIGLDRWIDMLRAERIDTMFLTTSMFHMLARERPSAFAPMRTLLVGGEQLELGAARRVLEAGSPGRFVNVYGPTETTTFATFFDLTKRSLANVDRIPIGYPIQRTSLHILDEDLRPLSDGEVGELCIGGPGVGLGYLGRPDLTAERFVSAPALASSGAPVYRTGDQVRRLGSGALEYLGRSDRQVKLRGLRIELGAIERAAVGTGLVEVALVEKLGEGSSAQLVGFVLPAGSGAAAAGLPQALGSVLARKLPGYMLPSRWIPLASLPLGPTGKTDRAALLHQVAQVGPAAATASVEDSTAARVAEIWCGVLGTEHASPDDNFLDVGGNSILAIQLASRIREALSADCEPSNVLFAASLAELTDVIRQMRST